MVYGFAGAPVKISYQGWEAGVFPLRGALSGGAPVATGWPGPLPYQMVSLLPGPSAFRVPDGASWSPAWNRST
jgi:hypothetical protein